MLGLRLRRKRLPAGRKAIIPLTTRAVPPITTIRFRGSDLKSDMKKANWSCHVSFTSA